MVHGEQKSRRITLCINGTAFKSALCRILCASSSSDVNKGPLGAIDSVNSGELLGIVGRDATLVDDRPRDNVLCEGRRRTSDGSEGTLSKSPSRCVSWQDSTSSGK
jgi:hypothetical protein